MQAYSGIMSGQFFGVLRLIMIKEQIISDNSTTRSLLTELSTLLIEHGAWLHKDLKIVEKDGHLSIHIDKFDSQRKNYMRVPISLMPALEDYRIHLDQGRIKADYQGETPNSVTTKVMELMLELYNATNKLTSWKSCSPFCALHNLPDLWTKLLNVRGNQAKSLHYIDLINQQQFDQLYIDSFLGSRCFNLKTRFLEQENIDDNEDNRDNEDQSVLLPLIDFLNHDLAAEPFDINQQQKILSMRTYGRPNPESRELFIRYNQYDAVDTFLFYGFVDRNSPWLSSIPLQFNFAGRSFRVVGRSIGCFMKGKLDKAVQDLRLFLPIMRKNNEEDIILNKLVIPGEKAPRALRRVLFRVLHQAFPQWGEVQLKNRIQTLENLVVNQNLAYWQSLLGMAEAYEERKEPVFSELLVLCRQNIAHCQRYQQIVSL